MRIEPIGGFEDLSVSMHGGGQLGRDTQRVFGVSELVLNGLEHPIAPCGIRRDDSESAVRISVKGRSFRTMYLMSSVGVRLCPSS